MKKEEREKLIDKLLIELNDQVELTGRTISSLPFDFQVSENDLDEKYISLLEVDVNGLRDVLNVCLTRRYLKHTYMGHFYNGLGLTEEGQGRAISADAANRNPKPAPDNSASINIGTINSSGATQIGHGNIQNVGDIIQEWIKKIDATDAPEEQKSEAKNLLTRFIEHPLVNTCIGIAGGYALQ